MADNSFKPTLDPFGLVDSRVLRQIRMNQRAIDQRVRQNKLSGVNYASAEFGAAIADAIGFALTKTGVLKDKEKSDADKVDIAKKKAIARAEGDDPMELTINQHRELAKELVAAGLTNEASTVLARIPGLKEQQLALAKLESESRQAKVEADVSEATENDVVMQARQKTMSNAFQNAILLVDMNYANALNRVELDQKLQTFDENRKLQPFKERTAAADAAIREAEVLVGGPVPTFNKYLNERENILAYLADHPNDKTAQERLDYINKKLETDASNIQRNVDNYQPTTAMLTQIQGDIRELDRAQQDIHELTVLLEQTGESVGAIPQFRAKAANVTEQLLPLLGIPQQVTSSIVETVAPSGSILEPQSLARKLRIELLPLVRKSGRTTKEDLGLLEDLIQATEDSTSDRAALVALGHTYDFLASRQLLNFQLLENGFRGMAPSSVDPRTTDGTAGPQSMSGAEVSQLLDAAERNQ